MPESVSVHAWDLPYHGNAGPLSRPDEPVRDELVERLDDVVSEIAGPVVLVGHSLGGYVSLSHALAHPDKTAGLVLISTGPGFSDLDARNQWNQWARDNADPEAPDQELLVFHHDSVVLDRLAEVRAPTVVLQGERDTRFEAARKVFEARLQNAEAHVIEGGGHNIHIKQADVVAERITDWVARQLG